MSKGRVKGGKGVSMICQRLRRCGNADKTRLWRWDTTVDKSGLGSGEKGRGRVDMISNVRQKRSEWESVIDGMVMLRLW